MTYAILLICLLIGLILVALNYLCTCRMYGSAWNYRINIHVHTMKAIGTCLLLCTYLGMSGLLITF